MTDITNRVNDNPSPEIDRHSRKPTSLIVGVGPGFGYGVARTLARAGHRVAVASRNAGRLDCMVEELKHEGLEACAYGCDATDELSVRRLLSHVTKDFGAPELVIYSVQYFCSGETLDIETSAFEDAWRNNCLGGFLVAREASQRMLDARRGTIIFVGSTSSLLGREGHLTLAVGKFGLRGLSQVMARELWASGIHVAHLVIDADINENDGIDDGLPHADPEHIAEMILTLHKQPSSAWTSEIDIRPSNEKFWQHC